MVQSALRLPRNGLLAHITCSTVQGEAIEASEGRLCSRSAQARWTWALTFNLWNGWCRSAPKKSGRAATAADQRTCRRDIQVLFADQCS